MPGSYGILNSRINSVVWRFSEMRGSINPIDQAKRTDYAFRLFDKVINQLQHYIDHPEDFDMAQRGYTLSVAVNFDDEERHEQMIEAMRTLARRALTQSSLLSDGRKPRVKLSFTDFVSEDVEIGIKEDEP